MAILTSPTSDAAAALTLRPNNQWTMYYRHGMNALLSKNFIFDGPLGAAVERAQKHCGIMGYKYHFVRPTIADLEKEENQQLGRPMPGQPG